MHHCVTTVKKDNITDLSAYQILKHADTLGFEPDTIMFLF